MDLALTSDRSLLTKEMDGDEIRWKPPPILLVPLIICAALLFFVDIFQLKSYQIPANVFQLGSPKPRFSSKETSEGFLIKTEGCRIPDMNPFDPLVKSYIFNESAIKCNHGKPSLMESNLTSIYILQNSFDAYSISNISLLSCCYTVFTRRNPKNGESDNKYRFDKTCTEVNQSANIKDEFIRVTCKYNQTTIYKDMFSFVQIKRQVYAKYKPQPLNVLVVGIDAVSRLNFHRQMPKTIFMLQSLRAVELLGYNKVADNTFPNLIPVLTGFNEAELEKKYLKVKRNKNHRFDECPFVWNKYNKSGYATAFGEDSAWMGVFNYVRNGFLKQPTDYYWTHFNYASEQQIGNQHNMNVNECVGSRIVHTTLLKYIEAFATSMDLKKIPYFGFFWSASLSHDYLNKPKLGDDDFAKLINKLAINGHLNKTVLIVMSDHGIRWGGIRSTYQGRMEERLPFLFLALPEKYRHVYSQAYNNLRKNSRKLTTPFDLHETLNNFLDFTQFTNENLAKRGSKRRRGYSLFESIPLNRTCESAEIESHWCACQSSSPVDINNDTVAQEAANFTIQKMNEMLEGYASCAHLSLAEIKNARLHSFTNQISVGKNIIRDYTITFRTTPGDGVFEVTVRQNINKDNKKYSFSITGTISRINLYGSQSLCITDFHLKLYCYCKT